MNLFFPVSATLVTIASLLGCTGTLLSDEKPSLEQCLAIQSSQSQSLTQLDDQLANLNASLALISEQLEQEKQPAEEAPQACIAFEQEPTKLIVGRQELVWLQDLQLALPARVDTGAETASIDARNIEFFERDGTDWVRFDILHPETGEPVQMERLLKRQVSIIQSNTTEAERRPVIELGIAIGTIKQTAEFTLSNRSHLNHQILIGRNILRDVMIVDVSQSNIAPYIIPEPTLNKEVDKTNE